MIYQLSKHAEGPLREGVELLLMCRQTQPHVDSNLNWHLQALSLVHGVLSKQQQQKKNYSTNSKVQTSEIRMS